MKLTIVLAYLTKCDIVKFVNYIVINVLVIFGCKYFNELYLGLFSFVYTSSLA